MADYLVHCVTDRREWERVAPRFRPLLAVSYRDLAALVSPVQPGATVRGGTERSGIEGGDSAAPDGDGRADEDRQADGGRRAASVRRFKHMNLELARSLATVPFRFGMLVASEEELRGFLSSSYVVLARSLEKLRDRVEFFVEVRWNLEQVFRELLDADGELRRRVEGARPGGAARVGRIAFEAAEARRREIARDCRERLSVAAVEWRAGEASQKEVLEGLVLKDSYLIDRDAEARFDAAVRGLAGEAPAYLRIHYGGPLPPHSFVPLSFEKGNYRLVNRARRALELPERATLGEIKGAYRRLARRHHPDRNGGDPEAAGRFREVNEAYETVRTYCTGRDGRSEPDEGTVFSFRRPDVEGAFALKRRGADR